MSSSSLPPLNLNLKVSNIDGQACVINKKVVCEDYEDEEDSDKPKNTIKKQPKRRSVVLLRKNRKPHQLTVDKKKPEHPIGHTRTMCTILHSQMKKENAVVLLMMAVQTMGEGPFKQYFELYMQANRRSPTESAKFIVDTPWHDQGDKNELSVAEFHLIIDTALLFDKWDYTFDEFWYNLNKKS